MRKALLLLLLVCSVCACHRPVRVVEATSEILMIDSTLDAIQDTNYQAYIAPIKADLEQELNIPIGYAPETMTVHKPECQINKFRFAAGDFFCNSHRCVACR